MLGLVLTAGGARGAYQVGVLRRLGEIRALRGAPLPFAIVAGASAGAINGSLLAAHGTRFDEATTEIARLWSALRVDHVIRTDFRSLVCGGAGLARDFILGGLIGRTLTTSFFDAAPLYSLIERSFPPQGIARTIRQGHLYAIAVSATSYHSGRSITFVQGRPGHPVWVKSRRLVLPVTLRTEHILASAAIPLVFPPVRIASGPGELWFGDGGLRLVAPFSPAIRLGATRVFAIGIRSARAADALARDEVGDSGTTGLDAPRVLTPPLAQICGVFMNAIFLDHLDADLDHLRRMNDLIAAHSHPEGVREPMRVVTPLVVSPSEDLAMVAQRFAHRMPRLVRYVLDGLGTPDAQSADLMSYLLFDHAYTRALIDIGYRDADARIEEIEEFLRADRLARTRGLPPVRASRAPKRVELRPTPPL
jgi:NTE family protein